MIWFYKIEYWRETELKSARGLIGVEADHILEELENMYGSADYGSIEQLELRPLGTSVDEDSIFDIFD